MKKLFFIFSLIAIILLIWYGYSKRQKKSVSTDRNNAATNQLTSYSQSVTPIVVQSNSMVSSQVMQTNTSETFNALTATNLDQWKAAIKNLKQLGGFKREQHWIAEQPNRHVGLLIALGQGTQAVQYSATLIGISAKNDTGDIIEIQMQTPNMNIDETKQLGLQIYNMLGQNPADFLAWCDKVGNHWMDQPLFGTKGNRHLGFETLQSFNDEKPWFINFIITPK